MKLLVVDDDLALFESWKGFFQRQNAVLDRAPAGKQAPALVRRNHHDVVILDILQREADGFEILSRIRENSTIPVLIVSANASAEDRVRGLELGADHFLPKPCGAEELWAQIRAILRRVRASAQPIPVQPNERLENGALKLLPGAKEAYYRGRPLGLTVMEFEILEQFMRSRGRVVSRDQLSTYLYKRVATVYDRSVDTHVARIRRKLGEGRDMILSVRGTGYQLRQKPVRESRGTNR